MAFKHKTALIGIRKFHGVEKSFTLRNSNSLDKEICKQKKDLHKKSTIQSIISKHKTFYSENSLFFKYQQTYLRTHRHPTAYPTHS